jgi:hypothetical protein
VPKYRKKPSLVDATQWFRNGDHPLDGSVPVDTAGASSTLTEGAVVKFFRRLHIPGDRICQECGNVMHKHGILLDPNENEEIVHPGDYIVTHKTHGHFYRRSSTDFEAMYEPYDPAATEVTELPPSIEMQDLERRVAALEASKPTPNEMIQ